MGDLSSTMNHSMNRTVSTSSSSPTRSKPGIGVRVRASELVRLPLPFCIYTALVLNAWNRRRSCCSWIPAHKHRSKVLGTYDYVEASRGKDKCLVGGVCGFRKCEDDPKNFFFSFHGCSQMQFPASDFELSTSPVFFYSSSSPLLNLSLLDRVHRLCHIDLHSFNSVGS